MATRKTFTPQEMRELAAGRGSQFLMDDMRSALRYAADLIEAADRVVEENRQALLKRNAGVSASDGETAPAAVEPHTALTGEQEREALTVEQIILATEHIDMDVPGCFIRIARAIERAHGIGIASPSQGEDRRDGE